MRFPILTFCLLLCIAPIHAEAKTELWVYTSVYKQFIAPIAEAFEKKYPDIDVKIFQAGSENIQGKVEAELLANRPQADFVMTSDPFWPAQLEKRGLLYKSNGRAPFEPNYYSLMILIAHRKVPSVERPAGWLNLADSAYNHIAQMGSPLESGTMFVAVAYLSRKYGWGFFEKLRTNVIGCSGGNSTVIQKVESGEKKVGMVLLENALAAKKRGSPIDIIYPSDGSIPIPSMQFILKASTHREEASKFSEFILSSEGQMLLRAGFMYPVNRKIAPPEGALPFEKATQNSTQWTPEKLLEVSGQTREMKKKFDELVLE